MAKFAETQRALADDYFRLAGMSGERQSLRHETGMMGCPVGYREYNPARDIVSHIDTLSPLGIATGEDYVRQVPQDLALQINVGIDMLPRQEHPEITARKAKVATGIAAMLANALPYHNDRAVTHGVFQRGNFPKGARQLDELIPGRKRQDFANFGAEMAQEDLPGVLISDFHDMEFPKRGMEKTMAVVLKDLTELKVVDEDLAVSLGGDYEIHTRDKKQTKQYEQWLEDQHVETLAKLRKAGMVTVSIITAINSKAGYDEAETDRELAAAFRGIAQRA